MRLGLLIGKKKMENLHVLSVQKVVKFEIHGDRRVRNFEVNLRSDSFQIILRLKKILSDFLQTVCSFNFTLLKVMQTKNCFYYFQPNWLS